MKRLFFMFLALGSMQLAAIASFPDTWHEVFFSSAISENDIPLPMYCTFYLSGDTIISESVYQKLYIDGEYPGQKGILDHKYIASIRMTSDDQKIYIFTNDEEYLLFDFSVNVGDTCHVYWGVEVIFRPQDFYNRKVIRDLLVLSKGELNGYPVIVLKDLKNQNGIFSQTTWIENVGATMGLSSYQECCSGVTCPVLLCASLDGEELYWAPDEAVSTWGYKNACPLLESVETDISVTPVVLSVLSPCYTILGAPAGENYHGIVIQNGKTFIK